jgi:MerR family redox-sensitive transcriptional activator SoxR
MTTIGIGEAARQTGLRQSAIRYYEAEGLLVAAKRSSGWRTFGAADLDRLRVIQTARELGFSLAEIKTLLNGFSPDTPPSARWHELARQKLPELNAIVERATVMQRLLEKGLRCHCVSVDDCIMHQCEPPAPVGLARRNQRV